MKLQHPQLDCCYKKLANIVQTTKLSKFRKDAKLEPTKKVLQRNYLSQLQSELGYVKQS